MPSTADGDCSQTHAQTHAQTRVQTRTSAASPNDSIRPPAPARCSRMVSRCGAAERTRLQDVVQQRIARLPHAQQLARLHPKRAAARTSSANASQPRTQTPAEVKSQRPEARQTGRSPREEWQKFIHRLSALPRTRPSRESNGRCVELTTAFVHHYTGTARPNSWIQDVGSRAVVELLPSSPPERHLRQAILHGSDRAVELAKLDLAKLQAEFESSGHPALAAHPTDVSLDTIDSVSSFARFVLQTTNRYIPPALQRDSGRSFLDSVSDALTAVFEHPVVCRFASTVALNDALRFLCRRNHAEAADAAHRLYHAAKALHLVLGISTFNILFDSAIRTGNAKRAVFFLREMQRESICPNSHTWTLLFSIPSISDKTALLRLIMESGIPMNRQGFAIITRAAIADLLPNQRPSCEDLQQLFADLDHIFGPDWLTVDSYHLLLRLSSLNPREGVVGLLNELPSRHGLKLAPDSVRYLAALNRKSAITRDRISDFVAAVGAPTCARQRLVVPRFFMAAWRRCFYNVCAVLWSFAATRGLITQTMLRIVSRYLVRGGAHPSSRSASRKRIGARIVAGVQWRRGPHQVAVMADVFPKLARRFGEHNNARRWLTGFTADDGTRDEQMNLFFTTLHDDLGAWKRFRPMSYGSLQRMLDQAYEADQRSISEGTLDAQGEHAVSQAVDRAICVPLTKLVDGEANWAVQAKINQRDRVMDAARLSRRRGPASGTLHDLR
ncbi:hypothetical protein DV737_g4774, partial [Chaetothyriales sp. CBS 132003]